MSTIDRFDRRIVGRSIGVTAAENAEREALTPDVGRKAVRCLIAPDGSDAVVIDRQVATPGRYISPLNSSHVIQRCERLSREGEQRFLLTISIEPSESDADVVYGVHVAARNSRTTALDRLFLEPRDAYSSFRVDLPEGVSEADEDIAVTITGNGVQLFDSQSTLSDLLAEPTTTREEERDS